MFLQARINKNDCVIKLTEENSKPTCVLVYQRNLRLKLSAADNNSIISGRVNCNIALHQLFYQPGCIKEADFYFKILHKYVILSLASSEV
jgi:hypothetical protein